MNIPFIPFQGTETVIGKTDRVPGSIYFATDTGKIFLDTQEDRIAVGGGGVAILYANDKEISKDLTDFSFVLSFDALTGDKKITPKENDLIINADGRFFKVKSYNKDTKKIKCSLIAVSGTGGGGGNTGGGSQDPSAPSRYVRLSMEGTAPNAQVYIYGQSQIVKFKPHSTDDSVITLSYTITSVTDGRSETYTYTVANDDTHEFDIGSKLYRGQNTLSVTAVGSIGGTDTLEYVQINSIEMDLLESKNWNPLGYAYNDNLNFYCMPVGEVTKTLTVYLNNNEVASEKYNATITNQDKGIVIPKQDHGVYELKAILSYSMGLTSVDTDPLIYDVAFVDPEETAPLIWMKPYAENIVDHDKLTLSFMVYDPASPNETDVKRYVNGEPITTLENISYNNQKWIDWNISNYKIGKNTFSLQCGSTTREIIIYVAEDEVRDLDHVSAGLYLDLNTLDRSNKENKTSREKLEYTHADGTVTAVTFNEHFNWYNNGWIDDKEYGNSILRISNGAAISIPLALMNTKDLSTGLTFELRFRLRNVQKYENLINITSEVIGTNEFGEDIVKVTKTIKSTDGVWAKYFGHNIGMCLGTQEGFFAGSSAIASGRYKEDQIVTISFVLEAKTASNPYPLIYMYIDGILSSIIEYDKSNESFKSEATALEINSNYCDVDLFNVRIYKTALSSSDIVKNYLADQNDPILYDMNQIISFGSDGIPSIDYNKMCDYNRLHPDQLLQPYAVLECIDKTEDKLPYVKDGKKDVNVTFVNPSLDYAYNNKLISDEEYLCGAPSFYAENIKFDVQGTSSQGYPRRNYKGKFKKDDKNSWKYTNGPLKGKEIGESNTHNGITYKNFYMDNTYSESTFTWKADYMESSMTHNTGFASFVSCLYDYHPLTRYNSEIDVTNRRTTVYGFPMLVFHKTAQLDAKGNPVYQFVGRYNFNLDKGCNNVIGFKDGSPHPYVEGTFMKGDKEKPLDFEHIAECWELKHNQGGRVAFTKANFAETNSSGKLTVVDDFEVRYNYDADNIEDAIKGLGDFEIKSQEERNAYILNAYSNLERMVEWLMSTDTTPVSGESYVPVPLPQEVTYGQNTYTHDTKEYRLDKFRNEFTKHFDTHYCAIYFIMTEFLIQYDSRGKNMMIASWGPMSREEGADYIWFPIFYDIDTQLGVNNSGVPSWEYYDEPTKQGDFSTSGSVLWNNFYTCFYDTITSTYTKLRKNNFNYDKLNGYYSYDPTFITYTGFDKKTYNSYVMRGHRPMNVINVDQYYKYIAPTFDGYINTSGGISRDEAKRFYCLQGNRNLHRELFLRNRFNFMDSFWLGGTYSAEEIKQQFQIRCNANKYTPGGDKNTSDRYLEREPTSEEIANGFLQDADNPLNADWTWNLKPYLRQYVSMRFDEILQEDPKEYEGGEDPIATSPLPDKVNEVKNTSNFTQQLYYIGGAEYISSLGDISLKYPDEIYLTELKRLKDIRLGNDEPGYYNNALTKCLLGTSALDAKGNPNPSAKQLLESVVLTGVSALSGSIDITGSEKLKEFRALGTNIAGATFADGVQVETVHLPNTIKFIEFIEPVSLQNILTSSASNGVDLKTGYNTYAPGLFIEGVTDITGTIPADTTTLIDKYVITGGNMGYDSYKLLDRLIGIKKVMQNNTEIDFETYSKNLTIALRDVNWTPYRLVAHGETVDRTKSYKKLTENSTLEDYIPGGTWQSDTLNQLIYEVDAVKDAQKNTITDLSLLDLFLDENNNLKDREHNYYQDIVEYDDNRVTYPKLTGNIFVNNPPTAKISEYLIKNHYNVKYPELNILVNNVDPAYTVKLVEVDPDTSKITVLQTIKYERSEYTKVNVRDITVAPSRLHCDFIGWSQYVSGDVLDQDQIDSMVFSESKPTITLYAQFVTTSYIANYVDEISGFAEPVPALYGKAFTEPSRIPARDESGLDLTERLAFKGWTTTNLDTGSKDGSGFIMNTLADFQKYAVDPTQYTAERNYTFYALFMRENVLTTETDIKYFNFTHISDSDLGTGYSISVKPEYSLSGKITLPTMYQGEYVVSIGNFSYVAENQTGGLTASHIFFKDDAQYKSIDKYAFRGSTIFTKDKQKLQGIYLPETVDYIGEGAFQYIESIKHLSVYAIPREGKDMKIGYMNDRIYFIGQNAFNPGPAGNAEWILYNLPSNLKSLGASAFFKAGNEVRFGTLPINLASIGSNALGFLPNIRIDSFGSAANAGVATPLKSIGSRAFMSSGDAIDDIYIYDSVTTIDSGAFSMFGGDDPVDAYTTLKETDVTWDAESIGVNDIHWEYVDM